ncbi:hypothetical protein AABB24_037144 [Solanum stoloniferum]|uniref:Uncharacterized protein n=1 Tax=Solanum stoloniferum TaxID=62892 RepID=A0ABD2R3C6_9SOLN
MNHILTTSHSVSFIPRSLSDYANILLSKGLIFASYSLEVQVKLNCRKPPNLVRSEDELVSPVPPHVSPVLLDSKPETVSESSPAAPSSEATKMNKNLAKHLALGKEKYFGTKKVLRGRTFHPDIRTMGLVLRVLELLHFQGWAELFLDTRLPVHEKEVCEFYTNLNVLECPVATSSVNGVELVFDSVRLDEIFRIPSVGLSEYVWTKDVNCMLTSKFSQR